MSVTLCCMSGGDPARLAALLRVCRPAVDEIVLALDDRVDVERAAGAIELADRAIRVPYAPPPERMLPWLYAQCSSDWIFKLDDDEVPSAALLEGLRAAADPAVTHVWFPRRWLFGGPATYLGAHPWVPDFQLRLSANDGRLVRFPGVLHVPIDVAGPARYVDAPIYHLDLLRGRPEREEKVRDYERERPGLRAGGLAFNHSLYLPELGDAPLVDVPAADRALVDVVFGASPAPAGASQDLPHATREEIDALWPRRAVEYDARLTVRAAPSRVDPRERLLIEVEVENRGRSAVPDDVVQVGSRWGGAAPDAWTALPAAVGPGETALMLVSLEVPNDPGEYTVEIDLVHDGRRWFDAPVHVPVQVVRPRRVGIVVREASRANALPLAERIVGSAPAVEPVLVGAADGGGYATIPGPEPRVAPGLEPGRRRLRSFALAARRVHTFRREPDALPVDALVFAGLDATTLVERWVDLAAARAAADRGAPILLPPLPASRGALDGLLLRRLARTRGVVHGGLEALPEFLAQIDG